MNCEVDILEKNKDKTYDFRNTAVAKKLGLGTGMKSWNSQVEESKKALEEKHKKEQKIFGFDKEKDPLAVNLAEKDQWLSNVLLTT